MKGGWKDKAISFHKTQLSLASDVTFLDGRRGSPECKEARCSWCTEDAHVLPKTPLLCRSVGSAAARGPSPSISP